MSTALRHNVRVQVLSTLLVTVAAAELGHPHDGQAQAVRRVVGVTHEATAPAHPGPVAHR